jgi:predicted NACHT family NTPase
VPIFVTLKAYAEERGQPSLEHYILTEFEKREVGGDAMKRLLKEGRALILLDGLDEVKKEDDRRVKRDIDKFSRDWLKKSLCDYLSDCGARISV